MRGSITASPNGESFPIKTTLTLQGNFTLANVPANPTAVALILTPPNAASRKYVAGFPIDGVGIVRTDVGVRPTASLGSTRSYTERRARQEGGWLTSNGK
jgi:hypothetical protein